MADRLAGKVAIVTGAGSRGPGIGTGRAMSILFAREGAHVCLVDRDPERALETHAMLVQEGLDGTIIAGDVTDTRDCERIVAEAIRSHDRLDILVNNAAIVGPVGPLDSLELSDWEQVLRVNLTGAMLMTKSALAGLVHGGGAIVNISSTGALVSTGQTSAYGASKAALLRLTADVAIAYGRHGVRANAIAPGNIHTPLVSQGMPDGARGQRAAATALGTEGDAWDIAWAAVFLASDEARWITGVTLAVDGGMTQANPMTLHRWLIE